MNFLHYPLDLDTGDVVEVTLDHEANVRLLDEENFAKYENGERHTYYGGLAKKSPVRIRAPHAGTWHLAIDLGGYPGTVTASVTAKKGEHAQRYPTVAAA